MPSRCESLSRGPAVDVKVLRFTGFNCSVEGYISELHERLESAFGCPKSPEQNIPPRASSVGFWESMIQAPRISGTMRLEQLHPDLGFVSRPRPDDRTFHDMHLIKKRQLAQSASATRETTHHNPNGSKRGALEQYLGLGISLKRDSTGFVIVQTSRYLSPESLTWHSENPGSLVLAAD